MTLYQFLPEPSGSFEVLRKEVGSWLRQPRYFLGPYSTQGVSQQCAQESLPHRLFRLKAPSLVAYQFGVSELEVKSLDALSLAFRGAHGRHIWFARKYFVFC